MAKKTVKIDKNNKNKGKNNKNDKKADNKPKQAQAKSEAKAPPKQAAAAPPPAAKANPGPTKAPGASVTTGSTTKPGTKDDGKKFGKAAKDLGLDLGPKQRALIKATPPAKLGGVLDKLGLKSDKQQKQITNLVKSLPEKQVQKAAAVVDKKNISAKTVKDIKGGGGGSDGKGGKGFNPNKLGDNQKATETILTKQQKKLQSLAMPFIKEYADKKIPPPPGVVAPFTPEQKQGQALALEAAKGQQNLANAGAKTQQTLLNGGPSTAGVVKPAERAVAPPVSAPPGVSSLPTNSPTALPGGGRPMPQGLAARELRPNARGQALGMPAGGSPGVNKGPTGVAPNRAGESNIIVGNNSDSGNPLDPAKFIDPNAAATKFLTGGAALDVNTNPALAGAVKAGTRPIVDSLLEEILPSIRSEAALTGNFGSSRQGIAEGLAMGKASRAIGDTAANITNEGYKTGMGAMSSAYGNLLDSAASAFGTRENAINNRFGTIENNASQRYATQEGNITDRFATTTGADTSRMATEQQGRSDVYKTQSQNMLQSLGLLPQTQGAMTAPAVTTSGVGEVKQAQTERGNAENKDKYLFKKYEPFNRASDLLSLMPALPGGAAVSTGPVPQSNPITNALGGASIGASVGSAIPGLGTGIGAAVGGVGGLLSNAFRNLFA